jgi:hypothetical protein
VLISDVVGGLSGMMLAIPVLKDQFYRQRRSANEIRTGDSPWPQLRRRMAQAWDKRRDGYDGVDSFLAAAGALLLVLSFAMKLFDA